MWHELSVTVMTFIEIVIVIPLVPVLCIPVYAATTSLFDCPVVEVTQ